MLTWIITSLYFMGVGTFLLCLPEKLQKYRIFPWLSASFYTAAGLLQFVELPLSREYGLLFLTPFVAALIILTDRQPWEKPEETPSNTP